MGDTYFLYSDDIGKSSVAGDSDFGSMPDVEASDDHDDVIQDPAVMDDDDCHFAVPSQESIIESTDKNGVTIGMDEELLTAFEPGEYSYFKSGLISTWEGPNHWKMKLHGKPSSKHDYRVGYESSFCDEWICALQVQVLQNLQNLNEPLKPENENVRFTSTTLR